jgi:hypothetical protein
VATVARTRAAGQRAARKPARPTHGVCRLTLTINGTAYNVRPIPADPSVASKAYRLKKGIGTIYHLATTAHGPSCDCPDFILRRDGIDPAGCKHIKALVACGLFDRKGGAR